MGVIALELRLKTFTPTPDLLMSLIATIAIPTDMSMKSASSAQSHICLDDLGLSGWFINVLSFDGTPFGFDRLFPWNRSKGTRCWQSQTLGKKEILRIEKGQLTEHAKEFTQPFSLPAFPG